MMDTPGLNRAIYDLQRKLTFIETWASSVNAALQDHAGLIDHCGTTVDGQRAHL